MDELSGAVGALFTAPAPRFSVRAENDVLVRYVGGQATPGLCKPDNMGFRPILPKLLTSMLPTKWRVETPQLGNKKRGRLTLLGM